MYKETLRAIDGIGLFPVVSLLLFVTVFAVALVRVLRMDRGHVARLASLPLDADGTVCTAPEVRR
jgi:cytochrome c oxidase cbb3-type subunit 4